MKIHAFIHYGILRGLFLSTLFSFIAFLTSAAVSGEGFSTIKLRNSEVNKLNELRIEGVHEPIIMTAGNNLTSENGSWEFITLGRRNGLAYIQSVPNDGYSAQAAMHGKYGYIARYPLEYQSIWGIKYCTVAIYCVSMTTDTDNGIIGCELEYITNFKPEQKAIGGSPFRNNRSVSDKALAEWYLRAADANHDGLISDSEKEAITELFTGYPTSANNLESFQALDEFPNLRHIKSERIGVFADGLPKLVIKHSNLSNIEIDELETDVLDLSGCTNLKNLSLRFSKIGRLILPKSLKTLFLQHGTFGNLDMQQVPNLELCVIQDTDLKNIDLSKNTKLEGLRLDNTKLTSLDVSALQSLVRLSCCGNAIDILDISDNPRISELSLKDVSPHVKKLIIPAGKTKRNYNGYKTSSLANFSEIEVVNK